MKLIDHMRTANITDAEMAARIGGCSASAVRKWKYRDRLPDATKMIRIHEVTNGAVTLHDWTRKAFVSSGSVEPEAVAS